MTVEEAVQSILTEDSAITTLCPAARIKPDGTYQSLARPYIVHFIVSMQPIDTHDEPATLRTWGYQISIFGENKPSIAPLRMAVMAALEASVYPAFLNVGVGAPPAGVESLDTSVLAEAVTADVWYE